MYKSLCAFACFAAIRIRGPFPFRSSYLSAAAAATSKCGNRGKCACGAGADRRPATQDFSFSKIAAAGTFFSNRSNNKSNSITLWNRSSPPPMGCVVSGGVLGRGEATVQLAGLGKISGHLRETASGQGRSMHI